jgi:hypothetical protein
MGNSLFSCGANIEAEEYARCALNQTLVVKRHLTSKVSKCTDQTHQLSASSSSESFLNAADDHQRQVPAPEASSEEGSTTIWDPELDFSPLSVDSDSSYILPNDLVLARALATEIPLVVSETNTIALRVLLPILRVIIVAESRASRLAGVQIVAVIATAAFLHEILTTIEH